MPENIQRAKTLDPPFGGQAPADLGGILGEIQRGA